MACVNFASLCYIAGTNVYIDFRYTEDDEVTPIDITGVDAQMQYLVNPADVTSVKDLNGGVTDGANGLGRFFLDPVESQALLPIGGEAVTAIFKSHLMFTYPDATVSVVAGVDSTYEQNLIR